MNPNDPQPDPTPNESRPIWELVIDDMRARDAAGREKYGTPLQADNGRDPLVDAYQEVLDLGVYLRQEIEERNNRPALTVTQVRELICTLVEAEMLGRAALRSQLDRLDVKSQNAYIAEHSTIKSMREWIDKLRTLIGQVARKV